MDMSGAGITGTVTVNLKDDFVPDTITSIKWRQLSDGNWYSIDRGTSYDKYETTINVYGEQADIDAIYTAFSENTTDGTNNITLDNFKDGEYIFGADVDISNMIDAQVISYSERRKSTFKGMGLSIHLRAMSPAFTGTASFPSLNNLDYAYTASSDLGVVKRFTYLNNTLFHDNENTHGFFEGVFSMSQTNMQSLRRYIVSQRGLDYTISSIQGVTYPFGVERGTFPVTAKLIEWEDLGMINVGHSGNVPDWKIRLRFAEVI